MHERCVNPVTTNLSRTGGHQSYGLACAPDRRQAIGGIRMIRGKAEIDAMVQKAARGAGAPPGQAEDMARIALYLVGIGAGLNCVAAALDDPDDPLDVQWDSDCIKVRSGPAYMVARVVRDAFLGGVTSARLDHRTPVPLLRAALAEAGIGVAGNETDLTRTDRPPAPVTIHGSVDIPDHLWARLETFAARGTVAQGDASRIDGVGTDLRNSDQANGSAG